MMRIKMNKKLIIGLALALVLASGALTGAIAQCAGCMPRISLPTCTTNCEATVRPLLNATCRGGFNAYPQSGPERQGRRRRGRVLSKRSRFLTCRELV